MFGFGKKKEEKGCCCGHRDNTEERTSVHSEIKVLGKGCTNCKILMDNVAEALVLLGREPIVEKVTDMADIASYGVIGVPALVFGKKVLSTGKILSVEEAAELLKKAGM